MEMKKAIYIVTYKNPVLLQRLLDSLNGSELRHSPIPITIINNHSEFTPPRSHLKYSVLDNQARPDFSTSGHLARNWNQAIMHGFENLVTPKNDYIILAQNDTVVQPEFISYIEDNLDTYNYMSFGAGDEVQVMTPESVKTIGMYDERYCATSFQEGDYLLRAKILNSSKSSINDGYHKRVHNPIHNSVTRNVPTGAARVDPINVASFSYHTICRGIYVHKWGSVYPVEHWEGKDLPTTAPKQYIYYPYFEEDIYDLSGKYLATP